MAAKAYNVYDVMRAEISLEPMVCLFCGSSEVTYFQYQEDAHCGTCGKWQREGKDNEMSKV